MRPRLRLVKSTPSMPSSSALDACPRCRFYISPDGCACSYIEKLRPGGEFEALRDRALAAFKTEHVSSSDCPCPSCYMSRRWSWFEDRPAILRTPPVSEQAPPMKEARP